MTSRKRVLVCEDDPVQLAILAAAIGRAGFETMTAESPDEALKRTSLVPADAVVSDVRLLRGSAFDLLAGLRRAGRDVPTLMISGSVTPVMREFALRAGVRGLLEKPLDVASIVRMVRDLLDRPAPVPEIVGRAERGSWPSRRPPVGSGPARRVAVFVGPPQGEQRPSSWGDRLRARFAAAWAAWRGFGPESP